VDPDFFFSSLLCFVLPEVGILKGGVRPA
jgi:hypothetical protein